jgi:Anti-sigma-K factor rskA
LCGWEKRDVLKHEQYRELCAAASIGEVTPEELFELEQHTSECDACNEAYFDFLNLAAQQFAAADRNPSLSPQEAQRSLNSQLFTRRFFELAEREGIQFSGDVGQEVRRLTPSSHPSPWRLAWPTSVRAIAALVFMGLTLSGGYFYGKASFTRTRPNLQTASRNPVIDPDQRVGELNAANVELQIEIDRLNSDLTKANIQLSATETNLYATSRDRQMLVVDRDALESQLKSVQDALAQSQVVAASAQQEAAKRQDHASDMEAALVANQIKIHDLTEELSDKSAMLDQERQILALGHDVNDLMGARNLHIVDVVDTDPRGKTQPAFGRIFFTEGRSLVFYAYDLNGAKIQRADYQYRVWAKQEGGDNQVRSLGIFYSDDKAQRRWVFKCNDPKILSEIDSVFVTLEPTGSDPAHPKGQNLMYAYLRGQPNHP